MNTCTFCLLHCNCGHRCNQLKLIIIISSLLHDHSLLQESNMSLAHISITQPLLFIYWCLNISEFLKTSCN